MTLDELKKLTVTAIRHGSSGRNTSVRGYSGARFFYKTTLSTGVKVDITITDPAMMDVYSRQEIFAMLEVVRREEKRMSWKCPEPDTVLHSLVDYIEGQLP